MDIDAIETQNTSAILRDFERNRGTTNNSSRSHWRLLHRKIGVGRINRSVVGNGSGSWSPCLVIVVANGSSGGYLAPLLLLEVNPASVNVIIATVAPEPPSKNRRRRLLLSGGSGVAADSGSVTTHSPLPLLRHHRWVAVLILILLPRSSSYELLHLIGAIPSTPLPPGQDKHQPGSDHNQDSDQRIGPMRKHGRPLRIAVRFSQPSSSTTARSLM